MTKFAQGRGSVLPAARFLHRILQSFYGKLLVWTGKKDILTDEKKEVSAMGFEWKAAEDLEDLIYECKEVSASER